VQKIAISTVGTLTNQLIQTISGIITGTDAVDATVELFDNGGSTPLGTATVAADGTWSTNISFAGDGIQSIVAEDADAAGGIVATSSPIIFTLDTLRPTVASIVSPSNGTQNAGAVINFTLAMSKSVTVTGNVALTLNDGGVATYVSGSGTDTLVFATTVANGQNAATDTKALETVVKKRNEDMVKFLLDNGADPNAVITQAIQQNNFSKPMNIFRPIFRLHR